MKRKVIIKIGRSVITTNENDLDISRMESIIKQIKLLHDSDIQVIIVLSGAITCGGKIFETATCSQMHKPLLGGIGQAYITASLFNLFKKYELIMAQLLLTRQDFDNPEKKEKLREILCYAMNHNIVVMGNENDMVDLHSFQGNDYLASELAILVKAQDLLLLTDVHGVYDHKRQIIKLLTRETKIATITKYSNKGEIGGMTAKVQAAFSARNAGINSWIVLGKTKNILTRLILHNEQIGTKLY